VYCNKSVVEKRTSTLGYHVAYNAVHAQRMLCIVVAMCYVCEFKTTYKFNNSDTHILLVDKR